MVRNFQIGAVLAVLALAGVSAQQTDPTAKPAQAASPAKPTSPTYPTPAPVANPSAAAPAPQYGVIGRAANFTGNTGLLDPAGFTVGRRVFEAGARNARWHTHTAGQLVFAEAGRGRVQLQGQPIKEIAVGESAFIPGGTYHWHGAAPNENFTMMYVTLGQSKTTQGEPVTEDAYRGNKK